MDKHVCRFVNDNQIVILENYFYGWMHWETEMGCELDKQTWTLS